MLHTDRQTCHTLMFGTSSIYELPGHYWTSKATISNSELKYMINTWKNITLWSVTGSEIQVSAWHGSLIAWKHVF